MSKKTEKKFLSFSQKTAEQHIAQAEIKKVRGLLPTYQGYVPCPGATLDADLPLIEFSVVDERFSPPYVAIEQSSTEAFKHWLIAGTEYDQTGGNNTTLGADEDRAATSFTRSLAGTYNADTMWNFCQFGNNVIGTNYQEAVQFIDISAGTPAWADLITTSTETPKAKFCAVVRNQVVLGGIDNSGGTPDGVFLDKVWWSALDDATDFDVSETTQADFQRLLSVPGPITGLVGGEYGIIFKPTGIYRMDFVGAPLIYRFEEISAMWGTTYPRSIIKVDQDIYFMSSFGPAVIRRGQFIEPVVGIEKFGYYLNNNQINRSPVEQLFYYTESAIVSTAPGPEPKEVGLEGQYVSAAFDPISRNIFWHWPNGEEDEEVETVVLIYNVDSGNFSWLFHDDVFIASDKVWGMTYLPPSYQGQGLTQRVMPSVAFGVTRSDFSQLKLMRLSSTTTIDSEIGSGVFELEKGKRCKILGVRLVYQTYRTDHRINTGASPPIAYTVDVDACEHPWFTTGEFLTESVASSSGNSEEFLPFSDIEGAWFRVEVTIDSHTISTDYVSNIAGLEIWYEYESV